MGGTQVRLIGDTYLYRTAQQRESIRFAYLRAVFASIHSVA